jgi:hypothetical protein
MEFHPGKCQVLTITRNRNLIHNIYTLHGQALEHVTSAKYLGITLTSDLSWNKHITNFTGKANSSLGFLRRNLRINSPHLKTTAYKTLVRPLLEYAPTVWDPYTKKNIRNIEMVQRRSARYVLQRYRNSSCVSDMLHELGWQSLEERRKHQRLTMMYKMHNNLVAIHQHDYITPTSRPSRNMHPQGYIVPGRPGPQYYENSYFPRTVREWNALPSIVINAPTVDSFRVRLSCQGKQG